MSRAIFDQDAFYPFRGLIEGRLGGADDLMPLERFLRGIVLHDEMVMVGQPTLRPHGPVPEEEEWTEDDVARGFRNVIVGFAPILTKYEGLLSTDRTAHKEAPSASKRFDDLAAKFSGAGPGDAHYKAHLGYLHHLTNVMAAGGSVVCEGEVGRSAFEEVALPASLFQTLDKDWFAYARAAQNGLGFVLPPVLAIVLTRAARRDALLDIVRDLRNEWSEARQKVWALVERLKDPETTLKEANDVSRELKEAERLFSPSEEVSLAPLRIVWDVFASGVSAAGVAALGGSPEAALTAGATTALKGVVEKSVRDLPTKGRYLFRAGAFDLARRVRTELLQVESLRKVLARHLTDNEKERLGL